ncbi:MAG TPA: Rieske (2Fe-2S) protein [Burkholderiales bacterium]
MHRRKVLAGLAAIPLLSSGGVASAEALATVRVDRLSDAWSAAEFEFEAAGDRQPGILVRLPQDRWYASSMLCSHNNCKLMFVRDLAMAQDSFSVKTSTPILGCPCHFSVFDITQGGKVVSGPAPKPPFQLAVRIADEMAYISA